jgi:hypothetical protein
LFFFNQSSSIEAFPNLSFCKAHKFKQYDKNLPTLARGHYIYICFNDD